MEVFTIKRDTHNGESIQSATFVQFNKVSAIGNKCPVRERFHTVYRRTGFNCENLIIANYEFF